MAGNILRNAGKGGSSGNSFFSLIEIIQSRAESALAVTGRRRWGKNFLRVGCFFFYENCCNSEKKSQKIDQKVPNQFSRWSYSKKRIGHAWAKMCKENP